MTDRPLTATLRHLEQQVAPDPTFAAVSCETLLPLVRGVRRTDASGWRRLLAGLRRSTPMLPGLDRRLARVAVAVALVTVLLAMLALAGGFERSRRQPLLYLLDGTSLVVVRTGDGATRRVALGDPIGGATASSVAVSPEGKYAAVLDDRPDVGGPVFSSTGLRLVDLATGAATAYPDPGQGAPAWSNAGALAWRAEEWSADGAVQGDRGVFITRPGRRVPAHWAAPDGAPILELAWSPDGSRLLATVTGICDEGSTSRLYLVDPDSGVGVPVGGPVDAQGAAWSPDGTRVAALVQREAPCAAGETHLDLGVLDPATGALTIVRRNAQTPPAWSTDGRAILVANEVDPARAEGIPRLSRIELDGSGPAATEDLASTLPVIAAPDGQHALIASHTPGVPPRAYGGTNSLYVVRADGGAARLLATGVWYAVPEPGWSPDGTWIVFERAPVGDMSERSRIRDERSIWIVRPDGSGLRQLSDTPLPFAW